MSSRTRKSKPIDMIWQHPATGNAVHLRVEHTRNYLVAGTDHIEIHVIAPKKAVIPLTDTGYRSHFIDGEQLKAAGGARRFVEEWLAAESRSKEWQKKDLARQQGDLFQWAEAHGEVGAKRASRPKKTAATPGRKPARARDPG